MPVSVATPNWNVPLLPLGGRFNELIFNETLERIDSLINQRATAIDTTLPPINPGSTILLQRDIAYSTALQWVIIPTVNGSQRFVDQWYVKDTVWRPHIQRSILSVLGNFGIATGPAYTFIPWDNALENTLTLIPSPSINLPEGKFFVQANVQITSAGTTELSLHTNVIKSSNIFSALGMVSAEIIGPTTVQIGLRTDQPIIVPVSGATNSLKLDITKW